MSQKKETRGYFKYVLAADCETTGIAIGCDDPSYDNVNNKQYQAIAWGLVVAELDTLKPIEELYVEIQYDNQYEWSDKAQKVHGLSKAHLKENGVPLEDAVVSIASLILKYWGSDSPVCMLGHNVSTFDLPFLRRTLRSQDIEVRFANRHLDSWSVGAATIKTFNSDDLFEAVGLDIRNPEKHNALTDAKYALESVRRIRSIYDHIIGE